MKTYTLTDLRKAMIDVLIQGKRSAKPGDISCEYNLELDGELLHCVIGHMIKNDETAQKGLLNNAQELKSSSGVDALIELGIIEVTKKHQEVFEDAQYIHDYLKPNEWLEEFNILLESVNIEPIEVENKYV